MKILDGLINDLKVTNLGQLKACIRSLLEGYNQNLHLYHLKKFAERSITENQFATLIGANETPPGSENQGQARVQVF